MSEQRAADAPPADAPPADAPPAADPASDAGRRPIRRALLSVSDKSGLVELAAALSARGVELVSTGNSARAIAAAGISVRSVEEVTGAAEFLDGRVKTLHPVIHGGLLADTHNPDHRAQLAAREIDPFDLLVVNLYPFAETVASGMSEQECIEQIDIGGPAMTRAAAKNHASVAVVTNPADYPRISQALDTGGFTLDERKALAASAFAHTASYDVAVASWFGARTTPAGQWPAWTGATWSRQAVLRYGENPHQRAALYRHWRDGLAGAEQLHGKEMSYNNYVDVDAAARIVGDFADPAVAIVKHLNPCGVAVVSPVGEDRDPGGDPDHQTRPDEQTRPDGQTQPDDQTRPDGEADPIAAAHRAALAGDPVSAFGGVIAVNRPVTARLATQIAEVFTEVVVAPAFDDDALVILTRRKNLRLLVLPASTRPDPVEFRAISGGVLLQSRDAVDQAGDAATGWQLAAGPAADPATLRDLEFAWRACRGVKSNAILLASGQASVGIGMGQVNRVDAARLAVERAGGRARGSVAASDAFFPFADGLDILLSAGVRAVVQPGGSVRDAEVIEAAGKAGVTMYLTGVRHFFH